MSSEISVVENKFFPLHVRGFSSRELDDIALYKGGVVGNTQVVEGMAFDGDLSGGWKFSAIGKRTPSSNVTVVLVGNDKRTRGIAHRGKVIMLEGIGFTEEQVQTILGLRDVKFKFELAPVVMEVLENDALRSAFVNHPGEICPGSGRGYWVSKWGNVISSLNLSGPRELFVAKMVKSLLK